MKSTFEAFIQNIKQKTPEGTNTVDMLTEIIPMSKEAAYRRLRGQIDFSFSEIMKIAQKLNISLDDLFKTTSNQFFKVNVINIKENSFMEDLIQWQELTLLLMRELRSRPDHYAFSINNNISVLYLFKYDLISKFRLYKWYYQKCSLAKVIKMSELELPKKVISLQKMMLNELYTTRIHFIYSYELMESLVNDIIYFYHLELISKEEVDQIREEALSILVDMEQDATSGKNHEIPCTIHVTSINFENDFILWHNEKLSKVTFRPFGVNFFSIENPEVITEMKSWTDMLLKSSTLISFCGEKKRKDFFQDQRDILKRLDHL